MSLVTLEEIHRAADRIRDVVLRTPLLPCPWADHTRPLWLKPESLQPMGAFKLRGAQNAIRSLPPEVLARGVVAYSSGNHAHAVASAAASAGIDATIVIEDSAPRVKIEATRELGAKVVTVPMPEREATARRLAEESGATLIPPFDHRDVIAGQGTIGLEIVRDLPEWAGLRHCRRGQGTATGGGRIRRRARAGRGHQGQHARGAPGGLAGRAAP